MFIQQFLHRVDHCTQIDHEMITVRFSFFSKHQMFLFNLAVKLIKLK